MALRIERIPTLSDNYTYLVVCERTGDAAVIDAPEEAPVVARVERTGARVTKILSTHHHFDHCGANPSLAGRYGVPVLGHTSDSGRLPGMTDGLQEGDRVQVGDQTARVLHVPAHTSGHIAYYFPESDAVFCGDTLFAAGCGRLFEGTPEMMYVALQEKLGRLPGTTSVYCGHEYTESNLRFAVHVEPDNSMVHDALERVQEARHRAANDWHAATPEEMTVPSTIADEHAVNPFMRACDAEQLGQRRAMKDRF